MDVDSLSGRWEWFLVLFVWLECFYSTFEVSEMAPESAWEQRICRFLDLSARSFYFPGRILSE